MIRNRPQSTRQESSLDKFIDATCMLGLGVVDFIVRITANDFKEVHVNSSEPTRIESGLETPITSKLENKSPLRQLETQRTKNLELRNPRSSQRRKSASTYSAKYTGRSAETKQPHSEKAREKFKEENRLDIRIKWLESLGVERVAKAMGKMSYMDSIQVLLLLSEDFAAQLANYDFLHEVMKTFKVCKRENAIEELGDSEKLLVIDSLVQSCQNSGRIDSKSDLVQESSRESVNEPISDDTSTRKSAPTLEELFVKEQAERVSKELEKMRARRKQASVAVAEKVEFRGAPRKVKFKILD